MVSMLLHSQFFVYYYCAPTEISTYSHTLPLPDALPICCRAAARKLGAHQIAYARVADIGYGEIEARPLVRRAQPGDRLAAGTGIGDEHSDDHLPAGLKPLHRKIGRAHV